MEKNDQHCCVEEQHSNLDLIKKIQAQISILEKNSNQEAQSIIQEIQSKMNLLIKSSSLSAPKLKEEEAQSHQGHVRPSSPQKLFSSLTDSKLLQKDSAFSAFKTTDCAFNSTIVPLGRLIGNPNPTNNPSTTSVTPMGSTQVGSIIGEAAAEGSGTRQQEIQLKQDSAQIQVDSSNDKLENISSSEIKSPNPTENQTQKVKSEKAQYQQILRTVTSPSQLLKKPSNSLNNENLLGKRLREKEGQLNFKLDLNQYIQQSIAQSNIQTTAINKDDLNDDKVPSNLDSILNHYLSINPVHPLSLPSGGNMFGNTRQAAIAALLMNQYKINDNNYEALSANQRITQQLNQKLTAENTSFTVPNTNFKQVISPPDISLTMSSLSQQIQEMRKREQKLFKNVDVIQAASDLMTLQQVQKDSEPVVYSNFMQNPSIQESGMGKQISRNVSVTDLKEETVLRTQQIFGLQHQIKQQTSQPFVISKPQNHNEGLKQTSQKIGLQEPPVSLLQMKSDTPSLLINKLRMVLQQKNSLQKSQLSYEEQSGVPQSDQQYREREQRSRAATSDAQLRTKIIKSKQITEDSRNEEFKIQSGEKDPSSSIDGQNSQMLESDEDIESVESSGSQLEDCADLSEDGDHGSAKSVDNYNQVKSIIQEKRRDAKTKIIKKNLSNFGTASNSKDDKKNLKFDCPICFKKYGKAQALGGHMSKAHPQMSDQYLYKQKRRNERTLERKILQQAKIEYQRVYNSPGIFHRTKLNQIKLRIKDDLKNANETDPAQLSEKVLTTLIHSSKQKEDVPKQTKAEKIQSSAQPQQLHDERFQNIAAPLPISPLPPLFISHKPTFSHLADALKLINSGLFQGEEGSKLNQMSCLTTNTSNINQSLSSHTSPTDNVIHDAKSNHVEDVKESANHNGKQNFIKSNSFTNKVAASKPLFSVVSNSTQINGGSSKQ